MITPKHYDRANDGNDHAPDVKSGYSLHANRAEQNSSDDGTNDAQSDIEPQALAAGIDNLATNKACD